MEDKLIYKSFSLSEAQELSRREVNRASHDLDQALQPLIGDDEGLKTLMDQLLMTLVTACYSRGRIDSLAMLVEQHPEVLTTVPSLSTINIQIEERKAAQASEDQGEQS
jgi:hypothetical protein